MAIGLVISMIVALPLVVGWTTRDSGAARRAAASGHAQPAALTAVAPERCSARKAVKFYAGRISYWRSKMGAASVKDARRGHSSASRCPRYLAHVLQRKAYGLRAYYPHWWQRHIGVVVNRLDRVLASTPLAGTGRDLEEIARHYHVSPYFIVAVAATESSIGLAACSSNRKNIWGLSSCGSGWYVPQFASWREAYGFFAAFVNRQWPGHKSPWSLRGYAACSDCWARKVSSWMHTLFGVPAVTRYP